MKNLFLQKIWGLKEPHVMPKIATNLLKNYDFANRLHNLSKICFTINWKQKKKFQQKLFHKS